MLDVIEVQSSLVPIKHENIDKEKAKTKLGQ